MHLPQTHTLGMLHNRTSLLAGNTSRFTQICTSMVMAVPGHPATVLQTQAMPPLRNTAGTDADLVRTWIGKPYPAICGPLTVTSADFFGIILTMFKLKPEDFKTGISGVQRIFGAVFFLIFSIFLDLFFCTLVMWVSFFS
jgi:hypothetical protein